MKAMLFFATLFLSFLGYAKSSVPPQCTVMAVMGETVTLKAQKNKLLFIHNIADTDLWITGQEQIGDNGRLTSKLQKGNWSALGLIKGDVSINCIESRPGHEQQIPCQGAIVVCQWKKASFPANHEHINFWVEENLSLASLKESLGAHGFGLP